MPRLLLLSKFTKYWLRSPSFPFQTQAETLLCVLGGLTTVQMQALLGFGGRAIREMRARLGTLKAESSPCNLETEDSGLSWKWTKLCSETGSTSREIRRIREKEDVEDGLLR